MKTETRAGERKSKEESGVEKQREGKSKMLN